MPRFAYMVTKTADMFETNPITVVFCKLARDESLWRIE